MVSRRLVLCLDGTNNEYDASHTNVLRLYRMLSRDGERQLAYYQPGVGTLSPLGVLGSIRRRALRTLDSATAWMLERHVGSAYRFLMANYRDGDEVFVFGFSRGAYAARVLCGMLTKVGLLGAGMEEMVAFAWNTYARERDFARAAVFKKTFSRRVPMRFLGLWDTVSSVGTVWRPRVFPFTASNRHVACVRHAMALDERRAAFVQNLWTSKPAKGQDVQQVWFAGVHSDVGGGYPESESALSRISLAWMLREACSAGLLIDPSIRSRLLPEGDVQATGERQSLANRHESLVGRWHLFEYLPIPRWIPDDAGGFTRRWQLHRGQPRYVQPDARVHRSVALRIQGDAEYRPRNLPASVCFVD